MASNRARFDALRSMAFGSITNSYQALGDPFGHAMRLVQFINGTDGDILVSFDGGINDNIIILANTFGLYDVTSDQDRDESFRYDKNTQVSIKYSSAPTQGTFYAVTMYGKGE